VVVASFIPTAPFSFGAPSWAASHPCYEHLCPDPTPSLGFLSRTFWYMVGLRWAAMRHPSPVSIVIQSSSAYCSVHPPPAAFS